MTQIYVERALAISPSLYHVRSFRRRIKAIASFCRVDKIRIRYSNDTEAVFQSIAMSYNRDSSVSKEASVVIALAERTPRGGGGVLGYIRGGDVRRPFLGLKFSAWDFFRV